MSDTMREILFRGKRVDNGEWVKGFYVIIAGENHCIFTGRLDITKRSIGYEYFKVDPETVGQYTGLTDKNGVKIFEGDIVKIKGKIKYIFYGISSFRYTNYGEYAAELKDVNTDRDCEIVGNIHDSPELLEEKI